MAARERAAGRARAATEACYATATLLRKAMLHYAI